VEADGVVRLLELDRVPRGARPGVAQEPAQRPADRPPAVQHVPVRSPEVERAVREADRERPPLDEEALDGRRAQARLRGYVLGEGPHAHAAADLLGGAVVGAEDHPGPLIGGLGAGGARVRDARRRDRAARGDVLERGAEAGDAARVRAGVDLPLGEVDPGDGVELRPGGGARTVEGEVVHRLDHAGRGVGVAGALPELILDPRYVPAPGEGGGVLGERRHRSQQQRDHQEPVHEAILLRRETCQPGGWTPSVERQEPAHLFTPPL